MGAPEYSQSACVRVCVCARVCVRVCVCACAADKKRAVTVVTVAPQSLASLAVSCGIPMDQVAHTYTHTRARARARTSRIS
jgi:hypothetical protein